MNYIHLVYTNGYNSDTFIEFLQNKSYLFDTPTQLTQNEQIAIFLREVFMSDYPTMIIDTVEHFSFPPSHPLIQPFLNQREYHFNISIIKCFHKLGYRLPLDQVDLLMDHVLNNLDEALLKQIQDLYPTYNIITQFETSLNVDYDAVMFILRMFPNYYPSDIIMDRLTGIMRSSTESELNNSLTDCLAVLGERRLTMVPV
jgi:hypothetical protein